MAFNIRYDAPTGSPFRLLGRGGTMRWMFFDLTLYSAFSSKFATVWSPSVCLHEREIDGTYDFLINPSSVAFLVDRCLIPTLFSIFHF